MQLLYYLILKPLSYLPDRAIHWISDILFFLVYRIFTYRKKLVLSNLKRSFPEKSEVEIESISRKFYRQFCDTMMETLKGFSITEKEAQRRIRVLNPEVLDRLYDQGKDVIITGGHYSNWEATTLTHPAVKHSIYGLYTPISNRFMEKKVKESRARFGFTLISTKEYKKALAETHHEPRAFVFAIDQSPKKGSGHHMTFLGQDTAVLFGTEKTAKEFNLPVVAGKIEPIARGSYTVEYKLIEESPVDTPHGDITERCMREVEKQILAAPHNWLWTHRRWKHQPLPEQ